MAKLSMRQGVRGGISKKNQGEGKGGILKKA